MPDLIVCPHCHEQLEIPAEYHGRQVRCANCQNVFVATSGDMPVIQPRSRRSADDDYPPRRGDDRPRRPRRDEEEDRPPRRSNAGVIGLLLLTALTIGGCCGGLNLLMAIQLNPTLTTFPSPEGKFKVDFPSGEKPTGEPITTGDEKAGDGGWQVTANRPSAHEQYSVRCYDLKPEWRKLEAHDALEKVADAELPALESGARLKGEGVRTERTTHAGFISLDVMTGKGKGLNQPMTVMRCILAGKRVYVVTAQGAQNFHISWWVRQYFLSFEITDPNAKPPKKDDEPKKEKKQD